MQYSLDHFKPNECANEGIKVWNSQWNIESAVEIASSPMKHDLILLWKFQYIQILSKLINKVINPGWKVHHAMAKKCLLLQD